MPKYFKPNSESGWCGTREFIAGCLLAALMGCTTEQINTHAAPNANLPLHASDVYVVYEQANFKIPVTAHPDASRAIERIDERLQKIVLSKMPEYLEQKKIHAESISVKSIAEVSQDKKSMPWIYIHPYRIQSTCAQMGACSYRLTVEVRLLKSSNQGTLWRTEIQEPYMVNSFVYDQRYIALTEYISKAVMEVLSNEN